MKTIEGKYNKAIVYTDNIDENAVDQIKLLCDQKFIEESKIRIMPDVHAGMGSTIGTTMTIGDKLVPNLVGVDIGCGMETIELKNRNVELQKLDKLIYQKIPAGFNIRENEHKYVENINIDKLRCLKNGTINLKRARLSLGSLGGGNHFIELGRDSSKRYYLTIHSGSRNLGHEVACYYQNLACNYASESQSMENIPKNLAYLEGEHMDDYIHDMKIVQEYAYYNRRAMISEIVKNMKFKIADEFTTIHNYIDIESMILRKGAVSAKLEEKLLIPINMRDGSLICRGKGNADWNYSAPHGAGRIMSRSETKNTFTLSEYKKEMKGVYTTSINTGTLEECPMAYKSMEEILNNIDESVEVIDVIKPVYNFKASNVK
jgi:RNA-splicing ligase RtcB